MTLQGHPSDANHKITQRHNLVYARGRLRINPGGPPAASFQCQTARADGGPTPPDKLVCRRLIFDLEARGARRYRPKAFLTTRSITQAL